MENRAKRAGKSRFESSFLAAEDENICHSIGTQAWFMIARELGARFVIESSQ